MFSLIPVTENEGGGGCFWKVFSYLCISWGMGGEGDPFRNLGGGGRSGRAG
jgi:hypothetical protein